jgi:hypothetical protein
MDHPSINFMKEETTMGRQLESTLDFGGDYVGKNDGRNARLSIWQVFRVFPPNGYSFGMSFADLDNRVTYTNSGTPLIQNTGPNAHKIENFPLWRIGVDGQVDFAKLLIHTWDIDFLSGITNWNGQEYGISLTRSQNRLTTLSAGMTVVLECAGTGKEPTRYLNGITAGGSLSLAPSTNAPFSGTRWEVKSSGPWQVTLKCLGTGPEPTRYLNGITARGSLNLAPSTDAPFSGTRWNFYLA